MDVDECTGPVIHRLVPGVLRIRLVHLEEPTQLVDLPVNSLLKDQFREELSHFWHRDIELLREELELDGLVGSDLVSQHIKPNVTKQVFEVLCKLLVPENVIVLVLKDLLDGLDIVLFVSGTELYDCDDLLIVFVDLGLSRVSIVDRCGAQH